MPLVSDTLITALADPTTGSLTLLLKDPINATPDSTWTGSQKAQALAGAEKAAMDLATALSPKILDFVQTADVTGVATTDTVTVALGIPVVTAGTAVAQKGETTAPGAGTGTGTQSNVVHPI